MSEVTKAVITILRTGHIIVIVTVATRPRTDLYIVTVKMVRNTGQIGGTSKAGILNKLVKNIN